MSKLTYGTPCCEAFLVEYKLTKVDFYVIRSPIKNVIFDDPLMEHLANVFVKGYDAALKQTNKTN